MAEITARVLPPAAWPQLAGLPLAERPLNPACSLVLVVERDGQILAHLALLTLVHAEGLYIVEAERGNPGVSRALLGLLASQLIAQGIPEVLSQAETPEAAAMFEAIGGAKIPGEAYVIPVQPPTPES